VEEGTLEKEKLRGMEEGDHNEVLNNKT